MESAKKIKITAKEVEIEFNLSENESSLVRRLAELALTPHNAAIHQV